MKTDLSSIIKKPTWSKDVCVWIGAEAALTEALEGEQHKVLDLLDLFPPGADVPTDETARAQVLQSRLDEQLRSLKDSLTGRWVLVVKNAAVLARYRAGLTPFYDWFGSDRRMTILLLSSEADCDLPLHLQKDVRCDSRATASYLGSCLVNPKLVFREKS